MGFVAVLRFKACSGHLTRLPTRSSKACRVLHRRKSWNSAILRFRPPWHSAVVALPSKGSIDADRACSPTKPAPHRPSASSNLRCQADGIWTSLPGPKPLSAIARPLTSHQLPARSLGQLVRRCAGKHPISPSSSEPNYNRLRPSRGQALSGCASARPGHCGRI